MGKLLAFLLLWVGGWWRGGVEGLGLANERLRSEQSLLLVKQCVDGVRVLVARALAATHSLRSLAAGR